MDRRGSRRRSRYNLDYPDHLRSFIDSIVIKEAKDDPKELRRRANEKRRKKEEEKNANTVRSRTANGQLTEEDVIMLGKSLKVEFPSGNLSKPQTIAIVSKVFPRFDADIVMKNIFEVFDSQNTGKIVPNELLWVFSMSIKGKVEDKLKMMFKLYDKDANGEIDPDEMEDIFTKLCKIVEKVEVDQYKKVSRQAEEDRRQRAINMEKQREREIKKAREELYNERHNRVIMFSEKKRNLEEFQARVKRAMDANTQKKKRTSKMVHRDTEDREDDDKVEILRIVADQLKDPQRDCKKFDPSKRAKEIFVALDFNGDGAVTEDEFVRGCLSDEAFVKVIDDLSMDFLWSSLN